METSFKKVILTIIVLFLLVSTRVFAQDHFYNATIDKTSYSLCNSNTCTLTYTHAHNGVTYLGHYYQDGHSYHNDSHRNGYIHH